MWRAGASGDGSRCSVVVCGCASPVVDRLRSVENSRSGVEESGRCPRRLARPEPGGGALWRTRDVLQKVSRGCDGAVNAPPRRSQRVLPEFSTSRRLPRPREGDSPRGGPLGAPWGDSLSGVAVGPSVQGRSAASRSDGALRGTASRGRPARRSRESPPGDAPARRCSRCPMPVGRCSRRPMLRRGVRRVVDHGLAAASRRGSRCVTGRTPKGGLGGPIRGPTSRDTTPSSNAVS